MKTCLIDAAHPAQKIGSESRVLDGPDIGAKGGFSKVCKHFRMEEEHAWRATASDPKVESVLGKSGRTKAADLFPTIIYSPVPW
ncbi:hypothetical protein [Mesorhizobium sp.]|uniref:hypothetical protein n=1 Tax=Mesorhizobium sp. TaxID=1871066 RepID=UPI000FE562E7|nr:hypothetical protein [Mesorhizobium sp.]RWO52161.1 MAG: hypothetical protein EOS13_15640 [Mesorhizobium sp.]TIN28776.1 MAG: hypothetical protein E5Y19_05775 [Mesorhizobium sp.]TIN37427.1 MAG: hypothetical protein E5Y13_20845 [Mesorhizobium sp.]TJU86030.1 MAG: hypothetical protein E5Y15_11835 [Mesorhizobium sp.]TJU88260.1 MAG: hypothetical protein E5Y10_17240 [Mesorhizobium sp.]